MLAIRLQRTGRSGHTQFRVIVQDSHFSPKRGRVVAYLGNYDPHTKTANIDSQKASQYLSNGAQPSDRVARLLQKEGVKLPEWVKIEKSQTGSTRNPDKRRSTRPAEAAAPEAPVESPAEASTEDAAPADTAADTPTAEASPSEEQTVAEEAPAAEVESKAQETPAENTKT
jgi:small subunit ribosomal protein S16